VLLTASMDLNSSSATCWCSYKHKLLASITFIFQRYALIVIYISLYIAMRLSLHGFSCLPLELFELLLVKSAVILTTDFFKVSSTPHPDVFRILANVSVSWHWTIMRPCVLRMLKAYLASMYFNMLVILHRKWKTRVCSNRQFDVRTDFSCKSINICHTLTMT
jgi:hypothetical protein